MLETGIRVALEHQVVFQGIIQHQAVLVPILRDMADAAEIPLVDAHLGQVLAVQGNGAGGHLFQTGQAVNQLRLAVAVDTGDADDLPLPYLEGNVLDRVVLVELGGNGHVLHIQHNLARMGRALMDFQLHGTAHHHGRECFLGGILGVYRSNQLALPQNRDPVGDRHNLIELVGDKQDGLALSGKAPHDLHELVDLLGSQDCGGLVKNQNLIIPVKHLKDLGTLLHAHGDILDLCVQVYGQAVFIGQLLDLFPGVFPLQKTALGILRAKNNIIQHGEHIHQLEVLMHHADMQCRGIVGVPDLDHLTILFNDTLFRLVKAEQDAHQGGFSRTVFAQ